MTATIVMLLGLSWVISLVSVRILSLKYSASADFVMDTLVRNRVCTLLTAWLCRQLGPLIGNVLLVRLIVAKFTFRSILLLWLFVALNVIWRCFRLVRRWVAASNLCRSLAPRVTLRMINWLCIR